MERAPIERGRPGVFARGATVDGGGRLCPPAGKAGADPGDGVAQAFAASGGKSRPDEHSMPAPQAGGQRRPPHYSSSRSPECPAKTLPHNGIPP